MNIQIFMKRFCLKRMIKNALPLKKIVLQLHSYKSFLVLLAVITLFATSCKYESNDFGFGLIPGQDNLPTSCDSSILVSSQVVPFDDIAVQYFHTGFITQAIKYKTNTSKDSTYKYIPYNYGSISYNLLGEFKDKAFGATSASMLFQLNPTGFDHYYNAQITKNTVFLSLTLSLAKSDTSNYLKIGTASTKQTIQVYTLKDTISRTADSVWYSKTDLGSYKDKLVTLGKDEYNFDKAQGAFYKYTVKIPITDQDVISSFGGCDTFAMKNRGLFNKNVLKGFYITSKISTDDGGIISSFNLGSDSTFLELKYKNSATDTVINSYRFYVSVFPMGLSNYQVQSKPAFDTTVYAYLQGIDSRSVRISLPNLEKFRQFPVSINKAELVLTPDTFPEKLYPYTNLPNQMYMLAKNKDGIYEAIDIDNRRFNSNDKFGGMYLNKLYKFNITRYVQNFIKDNTVHNNLELLLKVPNSFASDYFDVGRVAFRKNGGIKLKIFYTKIK